MQLFGKAPSPFCPERPEEVKIWPHFPASGKVFSARCGFFTTGSSSKPAFSPSFPTLWRNFSPIFLAKPPNPSRSPPNPSRFPPNPSRFSSFLSHSPPFPSRSSSFSSSAPRPSQEFSRPLQKVFRSFPPRPRRVANFSAALFPLPPVENPQKGRIDHFCPSEGRKSLCFFKKKTTKILHFPPSPRPSPKPSEKKITGNLKKITGSFNGMRIQFQQDYGEFPPRCASKFPEMRIPLKKAYEKGSLQGLPVSTK